MDVSRITRGKIELHKQPVDLGPLLQAATPPGDIPYTVMMSTDAQCEAVGDICHRIYPLF